jgi:CheY-like chemotaxis protein
MISTSPTPKRTILCIDADETILRYEKALLERSGYMVLAAASAHQGLRLLTMCKCDAVLLDYDMPVTDGYEVAFEIRRVVPEVTVIMMSGTAVPLKALALVDGFIPKLEASRQLVPMIAELCAQAHTTRLMQSARIGNSFPRPSVRSFFEYSPPILPSSQDPEEDS